MTSANKQYIWRLLLKLRSVPYPGATYRAYDSPRDKRIRGGLYNWTYKELRYLYNYLIFYGEQQRCADVWLLLLRYKNKIRDYYLHIIYNAVCGTAPPPPLSNPFRLIYTNLMDAPVVDPSSVAEWNTYFDLPNQGDPFTSVIVVGTNEVQLGGSTPGSISIKSGLFNAFTIPSASYLVSLIDEDGYVYKLEDQSFVGTGCAAGGTTLDLPGCTTIDGTGSNYPITATCLSNVKLPAFTTSLNTGLIDLSSNSSLSYLDISGYIGDPSLIVTAAGCPANTVIVFNDSAFTVNSGQPNYIGLTNSFFNFDIIYYTTQNIHYGIGIVSGGYPGGGGPYLKIGEPNALLFVRAGDPVPSDIGDNFYWEIVPVAGGITGSNFDLGSLTGNFSQVGSTGILSFTILPGAPLGSTFYINYKLSDGTILATTTTLFITATNPTVTASAPTNITDTSVDINGNITNDGGSPITEKNAVTGLFPNLGSSPTTTITYGTGTGPFTVPVSGLTPNTVYYYGAAAVNIIGGGGSSIPPGGNNGSFTTLPALVTGNGGIGAITGSAAKIFDNKVTGGPATVTDKGICYSSTNNTPTILDSVVSYGPTKADFDADLTGLSVNTLYYARAYATNAGGTNYGNLVQFSTLNNTSVTESPGSAVDLGFGDDPWVNISNILSSDNLYATSDTAIPGNGEFTTFMYAGDFGFSIPLAATITGIEVTVECYNNSGGSESLFQDFYLMSDVNYPSDIIASNSSLYGSNVGNTDTISTIGGPGDLWGWTPDISIINSSTFGMSTNWQMESGRLYVDHITMKIYYTV